MTAIPSAAPALLGRLLDAGSVFGWELAGAWDTPLRAHLRTLVPAERPAPAAGRWLRLLAGAVADAAGEDAADSLLRWPVIQQSDHANLLLDEETWLNNVLFHQAAADAGMPVAVTSQCTTVVCLSRRVPPTGPVFLATAGGRFDVFGRSRNEYRKSSFCSLAGPVTLELAPIESAPLLPGRAAALAGRQFADAPTAYRVLNDELWAGFGVDHRIRRAQIDESTTAEALARHIEHPDSPIRRLLFDRAVRAVFLAVKRGAVASGDNLVVNRAPPDWFWLRVGPRLHPVVHTGQSYVVETTGQPVPLDLDDPAEVAAALRRGDLHGDRILAYLVRSMLPGAVAVGGSVQQDYTATYRAMLAAAQEREPFLETADLAVALDPSLSRLGGRPLLEPPADWGGVGVTDDPAALVADLLDLPVRETAGELGCASFYDGNLRAARARRADERGADQ